MNSILKENNSIIHKLFLIIIFFNFIERTPFSTISRKYDRSKWRNDSANFVLKLWSVNKAEVRNIYFIKMHSFVFSVSRLNALNNSDRTVINDAVSPCTILHHAHCSSNLSLKIKVLINTYHGSPVFTLWHQPLKIASEMYIRTVSS